MVAHLRAFERPAKKRLDKGQYWWELRSCEYYRAFTSPKIVWPDIANLARFSIDRSGNFIGSTCFCVPADDYFLLGILNSWVTWYDLEDSTTAPLAGGTLAIQMQTAIFGVHPEEAWRESDTNANRCVVTSGPYPKKR